MDPSRDLRLTLEAVRDGRLDPARAAALAAEWSPARHPSFLEYLANCQSLGEGPTATLVEEPTATFAGSTGDFHAAGTPATASTLPIASSVPEPLPVRSPVQTPRRYERLHVHRTGGLGQVWLARDTVLGREVALKTVRPDRRLREDLLARFVREARVTGRLEHPSIVPLYDLIEGDDAWGRGPCYVMRYVAGNTLAERIAAYHDRRRIDSATPLDLRALIDAFVSVCRAVAFAHSRGVLHRDLKGQNVVLGDYGEVFLLDWGLTKGIESGDGDNTPSVVDDQSGSGGVVGTPAYMSPEVAAGRPATKASDIFGLGAILYSILTGRPPVEGPTPEAILEKVRSADPTPAQSVNPAASKALAAICRTAMARDPDHRYATAEALVTDVQRWLADEPVAVYREPFAVRASRWARRHRTGVTAAAVLVATALVGLSAGSAMLWREEQRTAAQKKVAEVERDRAETNLDAAHALTIQVIDVTEKVLPSIRGTELLRRDLNVAAVKAFKLFAEQRPDSPEVRRWLAQLNRYDANVRRMLDETAEAEAAYGRAIETIEKDESSADRLAETRRDRAGLMARTGRLKEALAELDAAAVIMARLPQSPHAHRTAATIDLDRSAVEYSLGKYDLASASADRAIAAFRALTAPNAAQPNPYDLPLLAGALSAKASAERQAKGYNAALPLTKEARALMVTAAERKQFGMNPDDILMIQAVVEYEASRTYLKSKQDLKKTADDNLAKVVERFENLIVRHPSIPHYRGWLGKILLVRGEVRAARGLPAEAKKDFDAARGHLEPLVAKHPAIPDYRADLGRVLGGLARFANEEEAKGLRDRAIEELQAAVAASPDDADFRKSLQEAKEAK